MIPEIVKIISQEFIDILEKHFPGISKMTFDSFGQPDRKGNPALERMEMCVCIELLKAGLIKGYE